MQIPRIPYKMGLGRIFLGKRILLLGTRGRKTKKLRITPLQYDIYKDRYIVGSMRGIHSDWFKNIQKDNSVLIKIGDKSYKGVATPITDTKKNLAYLKFRLLKHPFMIRTILKLDGIKDITDEHELFSYVRNIAFVKIKLI